MSSNQVSKALGERFSFTVKNTTGGAVVVAILAAFFDTLFLVEGVPNTHKYTNAAAIAGAGYACDFVLDDGIIAVGLEAKSANSKMTIRQFREYIKNQGRILKDMSVKANNVAAFNESIEVVKHTPLMGSAPQYLPLDEFRSVDQSATDKVNVRNIGLEMSFDTLMLLPIQDGHEVSISFTF
jgi:hypothetical protein